ncbi:MAG: AI-2E family transporter [Candidatus Delongbacteria bacterium]|nr:AI-2E family transporter [Candidatus Delongbacteria bacterium]
MMPAIPSAPGRYAWWFAGLTAGLVVLIYIFELQSNPILDHTAVRLMIVLLLLFPYRRVRMAQGIFYLSLVLLVVTVISYVFDPIVPVLIAFGLAYLVNPLIDWLEKRWRLPRWISTLLLLISVLAGIGLLVAIMIPFLFQQITLLSQNFPQYLITLQGMIESIRIFLARFGLTMEGMVDQSGLTQNLQGILNKVATGTFKHLDQLGNMVSKILNILIFPFAFYYFSKEFNRMKRAMRDLIPEVHRDQIIRYYRDIDQLVGSFIRGQIVVCTLVGLLTYVALVVTGFDYALLIALMVTFLSLIPYIGTLVSVVTAVLLALVSSSVGMAVKVLIAMELVQFTEGNFITPRIMARTTGMHPLVVMIGVVIFAELFGFWGMLMAVVMSAVTQYFFLKFVCYYRQSSWFSNHHHSSTKDDS